MRESELGGIHYNDVIKFQVQIMLGAQFERVEKANSEQDVVIACLRVAWNDAFRHVTKNVPEDERTIDDKDLNDYIYNNILCQDPILQTFYAYVKALTTKDKVEVIKTAIDEKQLREQFRAVKDIDNSDRKLCFGHFQKLFNMALKLYFCLYMCRDALGISNLMNDGELSACFDYADCPIDNVILQKLDEKERNDNTPAEVKQALKECREKHKLKRFSDLKWSKIGRDEHKTIECYIDIQDVIRTLVTAESKSEDIRNRNFCQRCTAGKSMIQNACYTIRDVDLCQGCAVIKGI